MFRSVSFGIDAWVDCEVIGAFEGREISAAEDNAVQEAARRPEFKAKVGQVVEAFPEGSPRVLVVGLGDREKVTFATLRKSFAAAVRRLSATKVTSVNVRFDSLQDPVMSGRIFGEVAGTLGWNAGFLKTTPTEFADLKLSSTDEAFAKGLKYGISMADATNFARDLANTPPNFATPLWMAEQAQKMAEASGLSCRVIKGDELEKEHLTGLINVGKASINPPCLIRLEYRPEGSTEKPVVFVGKTITYDTGGLSIKGKTSMPGMKGDKAGGCAVLGAMKAIATLVKPDFPVVAILVAAENSISSNAYRPDDVITYRNGKTVEITNTDAEGRLVLADGLIWAAELENPACIIDMATLTGGVVTALGDEFAGYFSTDALLAGDLEEASKISGDRIWRLPLDEAYKEMMKSPVADLQNSNLGGKAHPVQGAVFLWAFVPEGLPWAHIDIAGVSNTSKDSGPLNPGQTGFGVRLLCDLVRSGVSVS